MINSRKCKKEMPDWLCGVSVTKNKTSGKESGSDNRDAANEMITGSLVMSDKSSSSLASGKTVGVQSNRYANNKQKDSAKEKDNMIFSVEKLVEMSMPEFTFKGSIIYSYHKGDCNIICDDILSTIDTTSANGSSLGLDTEWPVSYKQGEQAKTALVQICLNEDKCYLFHLSCMNGFPGSLRKLLENPLIQKVGLNVGYDLWKLEKDYGICVKNIICNSVIELKTLANQKLKSSENWSLEGLSRNVLGFRINKDPSIRLCDWSQYPLPREYQIYAATDAVISYKIYQKLKAM
ncbi:hypothetical protein CHS0354_032238 [Potamilus streckersoni]|uniref:3'-5' exonuclease n=1 Tax=Potamilus streckersoni TaxID=2493646 RepID=A0AAE0RQD7_9BIVA|nr:hypothetical protein CHS0354_032238 [Potamilus streckersoni]